MKNRRIAERIVSERGVARFQDVAPRWIPAWCRNRTRCFERIYNVSLRGSKVSADLLKDLTSLEDLKDLDLNGASIVITDLEYIFRMTQLKSLNLGNTRFQTDNRIASEPVNQTVKFGRQAFHDPAHTTVFKLFEKMTQLEQLDLEGTATNDDDLQYLSSLQILRAIRLTDTRTTEKGRSELRKALPNCEIILGR